jgi:hypothetical protein
VEILRQEQESRGHARHDLVGVALQVGHGARLPHLFLEQAGALLLAVQRDQEAGEGEQEERGGRARELPGAVELREGPLALDLEGEDPAGRRHAAHRGEHRHPAVIRHLGHRLASLGRRPGERAQLHERRALHRRIELGRAQGRQVRGRGRVQVHEHGFAGARVAVVGEQRVEPVLRPRGERDRAEQRAPIALGSSGRTVREHRHRDDEQPATARLDQIEARLAGRGHLRGEVGGRLGE